LGYWTDIPKIVYFSTVINHVNLLPVEKGNICSSSCIEHDCLIYSP